MADNTIQKFTLYQLTGANAYAAMLTSQAAAATSATNAATSATAAAASATSAASAATTAVNAAVSGTSGKIAKFTGANAVGDSSISDNGSTVTGTLPFLQPSGTASLPSWSFSADADTGIYSYSANIIGFAAQGVLRARIVGTSLSEQTLIVLGGTSQFPASGVSIQASTHATSRRAAFSVGDWNFMQDSAGNGTKDFTFYNSATGISPFYIDPSVGTIGLGAWAVGAYIGYVDGTNRRLGVLTNSPSTELHVVGTIRATTAYQVGANQVIGPRKTGWTVPTGTATRTGFATPTATVASATYAQAEITTLMQQVKAIGETLKGVIDDIHATAGHGLIGA